MKAIILLLALLLVGCSKAEIEAMPEPPPSQAAPAAYTPVVQEQMYFGTYPCTEDCSGHEAGYEWAGNNGIDDANDCDGNSDSFIEGCQQYVEENGESNE